MFYAKDMLYSDRIKESGYFNVNAVNGLISKMEKAKDQQVSAREDMAIITSAFFKLREVYAS